jgi:hypothetical protein
MVEVAGVVRAPEADVRRLLLTVQPGPIGPGNAWLLSDGPYAGATVTGGPDRFQVRGTPGTGTVEVDREAGTFAVQGGWWYRGEYAVEPDPAGARVTYRVYNVAGALSRWMVPLANRGFIGSRGATERELRQLIGRIEAELGGDEPQVEGWA